MSFLNCFALFDNLSPFRACGAIHVFFKTNKWYDSRLILAAVLFNWFHQELKCNILFLVYNKKNTDLSERILFEQKQIHL